MNRIQNSSLGAFTPSCSFPLLKSSLSAIWKIGKVAFGIFAICSIVSASAPSLTRCWTDLTQHVPSAQQAGCEIWVKRPLNCQVDWNQHPDLMAHILNAKQEPVSENPEVSRAQIPVGSKAWKELEKKGFVSKHDLAIKNDAQYMRWLEDNFERIPYLSMDTYFRKCPNQNHDIFMCGQKQSETFLKRFVKGAAVSWDRFKKSCLSPFKEEL